jgi:TolB-like protein
MRAHADRGERGLAIQAYERCRLALAEALDAAPSQETQRLVADIRAGAALVSDKLQIELPKRASPGRMGVTLGLLPLQNSGGGDEANDVGQGFAEDVLAALSCFQDISVISSASILQLGRGEAASRRLAELDFLLDGSVRYGANTARVTLRLIDLREDNRIVWTNHFDLERQDRFDLQDEIAARVAAQLQLAIERVESERASHAAQEESTAYDLVLYAIPLSNRLIRHDFDLAEALLRRAVALQPDYVPAQTHLAWHLLLRASQGWSDNDAATMAEAAHLADRAILLDPRYARAFAVAGHVRGFISRRPREALALHARAVSLNPNMGMVWGLAGMTYTYLGELDEAALRFERGRSLAPNDPTAFYWDSGMVMLEVQRRDYAAAIEYGRRMNAMNPNLIMGLQHYLSALGHAGLMEEATRVRAQLLALAPQHNLLIARARCALDLAAERDHYVEGLRKAGLS